MDQRAAVHERAATPSPRDEVPPDSRRRVGTTHTLPGTLLLLLLAGLALLDRSVALLSVPGVPIYPAEIVLGVGLAYLVVTRQPIRSIRGGQWFAPVLLIVYLVWGFAKVITSLHYPILMVVRDSALIYYALFAGLVLGLASVDSRFNPSELVRLWGRFVPWFLIIAPVRLVGAAVFNDQGPKIPGSDIAFISSHRLGNLGALIGVAVVYLASSERRNRATIAGIVGGIIMLIVIGTQNRGGMLAGGLAILLAVVLWNRHIKLHLGWVVAVLAATLLVAWSLDITVHTDTRDISVSQLASNVQSLVASDGGGGGQLSDTVNFRTQLWERVLARTVETGQLENGWGFGVNLGSDYVPGGGDVALRNPHNSHLTVVARLGLVGIAIWIVLWASWFWGVFRRARAAVHSRWPVGDDVGRLALLAGAGGAAILMNAYVDPTLETPMVAVWLWSLFGFGVIAVTERRAAGRGARQPAAEDA